MEYNTPQSTFTSIIGLVLEQPWEGREAIDRWKAWALESWSGLPMVMQDLCIF